MFNSSSTTNKSGMSSLLKKVSKSELLEISKPWIQMAARTAGVKSLYDVPEYFREHLELKGVKIGKKTFGKGLGGATEELLDKSNAATRPKDSGPSRKDLYKELLRLEKENLTDTPEYKKLEDQIESTRPTEVKEAIDVVNKKLSLTKEGDRKNSEARKEMARILRENRNKEKADRQSVDTQITTLLNDYTTQKVDGMTATKEALRTALAVGGVNGVMSIANLGFDAATSLRDSAQSARRSGEEFNSKVIAKKLSLEAKDTWQKITGKGVEGGGLLNRASAAAKISQLAAKFGVGSEVSMGTVGGSAEAILNKATIKFPNTPSSIKPKPYARQNVAKVNQSFDDKPSDATSRRITAPTIKKDKTRNVHTTAAPKLQKTPQPYRGSNQASHIKFKNSYSEAGLQPSVGSIRNVSAEYKRQAVNDPSVRRGGVQDNEILDFASAPKQKRKQPNEPLIEQSPYEDPSDYYPRVSKSILAKRAAEAKKKKRAEALVGRKIAGRLNMTIWSVGFSIWLIVQLPLAIFMMMTFGATFIVSVIYNISELFSVLYLIFFGILILELLIIYLLYKFLGLEPLGGEGSGFKYGALIMVFIGYSIPLLNLLPWFYVWTFAVWLKPK